MFVCLKYKVVFVAIPKTATRSIYNILKNNYNGSLHGEHAKIIPQQYSNFFSFCVIRNPYDRACSIYWHSCHRPDRDRYKWVKRLRDHNLENTFENFLTLLPRHRGLHGVDQIDFFTHNRIDQILRFENLQEDFNTLPFLTEPIELPVINSTKIKKWGPRPESESMLTLKAIASINTIYVKDFQKFKYKMR